MEFLSRQAWDISAHLNSIRYTTLESLQKELKGNWVLNRHSGKMLVGGKYHAVEQVKSLIQFRVFKDSSSKQEVTVPVWLLGRRKQEKSQTLTACKRKKEEKTISGRIRKSYLFLYPAKQHCQTHSAVVIYTLRILLARMPIKKILCKTFTLIPFCQVVECIWGRSTEARSRPGVWSEDNFLPLVFLQEWPL